MNNRRYLILRVSIFINVALLLYAAMHLSDRSLELNKYMTKEELHGDYLTVKGYEESTSAKTPSTVASTNKTTTSTMSIADIEKRISNIVPSEPEATNETVLEVVDEDSLSEVTLQRLRVLLDCKDREYAPATVQRGEFWVLRNYVRADHGPVQCHETVTYTTHAGYEFLDNVLPLVERWQSPISMAIYAPGTDFQPTLESIMYLRNCAGDLVRQYVTFHIYFSNKHIPNQIPSSEQFLQTPYNCTDKPPYSNVTTTFKKKNELVYPVNIGRNVARDAALTHFVLPSDIELYPSRNLVPSFLSMVARNAKPLNTSTNPRVFPLSIFEVAADVQVPSTKTELKSMLSKKKAIPFHKFVCPMCHNVPKGNEWIKANETNQMDVFHVGKRSGQFKHWEPIYIGTHADPYYDERLSWDGKMDKMTQGYVLCVKNYDFMILNNAFLIHKPGIKKFVKNPKRDKIAGRQTQYIKKIIMPELEKLFGTRAGCIV